jgi:uncharacterized protein YbjT (DUF2867 family)
VARILIVGGGCRGRQLAAAAIADGHAARITTRAESGRGAIEAIGAECWIGTPDRLATLRAALDGVTIICWLLGSAVGSPQELSALHTERLEYFLTQAIDTTARGFVYEARGANAPPEALIAGERTVRALAQRNAIPLEVLSADPADSAPWLEDARRALAALLGCG